MSKRAEGKHLQRCNCLGPHLRHWHGSGMVGNSWPPRPVVDSLTVVGYQDQPSVYCCGMWWLTACCCAVSATNNFLAVYRLCALHVGSRGAPHCQEHTLHSWDDICGETSIAACGIAALTRFCVNQSILWPQLMQQEA